LAEVPEVIHRSEALCPTRAPRAPHAPPWTPSERAWLAELRSARCASLELVSHLQVVVAQAKFSRLDACMAVACLVMDFMARFMSGVAAGMAQREAWMGELLAATRDDSADQEVPGSDGPEAQRPIFVWAGPPAGVAELAAAEEAARAAAAASVDAAQAASAAAAAPTAAAH
jgi:hypothetical protein